MKHYLFEKEPNDDKESKYYLLLIVGIIILSLIILFNFPSQAQDTIPKYQVKAYRKIVGDGVAVWYYKPIGVTELGAPLTIVSGGGGGVRYIPTDSICIYLASCGYPNCQISYKPHSITDVLFNSEKCLYDNMNDILTGRNYILTHLKNYGYPDTAKNYFIGLSYGAIVDLYLTYHTEIATKTVSMWGGVLNLNMINKDADLLMIHGTADKTVPFTEGLVFRFIYMYGSKRIQDWNAARGYSSTLQAWNGYGHGLTKTNTNTNNNLKIADKSALKFLYK